MRCEDVVERLPDYSADLLRGGRRRTIKRHLVECEACAVEYRTLMNVVSLVGRLPKGEPPANLWPAVRARIRFASDADQFASEASLPAPNASLSAPDARSLAPNASLSAPARKPGMVAGWLAPRRQVAKTAAAFAAAVAAVALLWVRVTVPRHAPVETLMPVQAPYVRAHLQYAGNDPLVGSAGTEPLIVLAGRTVAGQRK